MAILICDDHALMRAALRGAVEDMALPGPILTARDFPEAWRMAESSPDISLCLVDLYMPGADGISGLTRLLPLLPDARTLVVTGSDADHDLLAVMRLDVHGFIAKAADAEILQAAIRLVLAGERYIPPRLAEMALATLPNAMAHATSSAAVETEPRPQAMADPTERLSQRQREVLQLVSQGLTNKEIARRLALSVATVKAHVAQVIAIFGVRNRTEASLKYRTPRAR